MLKPDVVEKFKALGLKLWVSTPAELDAFVKKEIAYWGTLIPTLGLEPE